LLGDTRGADEVRGKAGLGARAEVLEADLEAVGLESLRLLSRPALDGRPRFDLVREGRKEGRRLPSSISNSYRQAPGRTKCSALALHTGGTYQVVGSTQP
jgi:hypothetical protein